jgi:hypothetical protein
MGKLGESIKIRGSDRIPSYEVIAELWGRTMTSRWTRNESDPDERFLNLDKSTTCHAVSDPGLCGL